MFFLPCEEVNAVRKRMARRQQKKEDKIASDDTQVTSRHGKGSHLFSADRPITSKEEDLLDRADFATALATAIDGWNESDSLVVALYGPWGSGKSSVKNMVLEALRSKQGTPATVVEFNPWQWAGQDQLAEAFFTEVEIALGKADASKQGRRRAAKWHLYEQHLKVGSLGLTGFRHITIMVLVLLGLVGLASITRIAWVTVVAGVVGGLALMIAAALKWIAGFADEVAALFSRSAEAADRNLNEIKADLADDLSALAAPVVIVIDDLDRLAPNEIQLMFQLIKANADFPNVVYLVLFQRTTIEGALGERGREFLDKIVQVGFDIPLLQQPRIDKVLFQRLDDVLGEKSVGQRFDGERWVNLYFRGFQAFFRTLRDVHRFGAVFAFEVGQFRGDTSFEVNPIDLIGLEVLRVFEPEVYQALPSAKSVLTGRELLGMDRSYKENATRAAVEAIIEHASKDRTEAVREVVKQLFPAIEWVFGGSHYGADFADHWYRELRVCHPDVFDRYFLLAIPEGDISQADLDRVLHSVSDAADATAVFSTLKQRGLLDTALNRLEAYKQEIDLTHAVPFITALFNVSEDLSPYSSGIFDIDSSIHVVRIIHWHLATEPDREQRMRIVCEALQASSGLFMPVYFISLEGDGKTSSILETSHLPILKQVCLKKIRVAAEDGHLASHPNMGILLYQWREWSSGEEPEKWVASLIESKEGFLAFLGAFVQPVRSWQIGGAVVRTIWRIRLSDIEPFVAADIVEARAKELEAGSLSERDQRSLHALEQALERRRRGIAEDAITLDE